MRRWRPWTIGLPLMAGVLTLVAVDSRLSAQAPPLEGSKVGDSTLYESSPKLVMGPKGESLRMWYRSTTPGTGGTILAAATASGWQPILTIMPEQKDVTAGVADLAIGAGGHMAVAYQWWQKLPTSSKQIRVARSSDGGKTWTQPAAALDTSGKAFTPKAAWGSDGTLVVVWADEQRSNRVWDVYSRRSSDGGATWEPEVLLSRFAQHTPTDAYVRPEVISDGDKRFWTIWTGIRSARSRVYLNRSTDGGRTWTDPLELSGQSESVYNHRIVRSGDHVLIVWQDRRTGRERVYCVTSSDGGVAWSAPARVDHLSDELRNTDAFAMTLTMSPDREVFVAWNDGRNGRDDIFFGRSRDGGRTWDDKDVRLDMDEPGTAVSRFPSIARAANGRTAVAWEDDRAGYEGVYVRVRSAGLEPRWGPEILVEGPSQKKGARLPVVSWAADGSLEVAWEVWDYTGGPLAVSRRIDSRRLAVDGK
jgi:BNR repeat-like domain